MIRKGFTLIELLVGMTVMGALIIGTLTIFSESMKGFHQTKTDIDLATDNTLAMQRVAETLRGAYTMQIQNNGAKVVFFMPRMSLNSDVDTGEKEIFEPIQSDGVQRSFSVANGVLKDDVSGRVLAENVVLTDPDPLSSQYNQTYAPFQLTTIGSRRALSINIITKSQVLGKPRYSRMKTTVILRNSV